jgi:hypothetical protein
MKTRLKQIPIYPFLLAAYPVLALAAHNIDQIQPGDMLRPLLLSLLVAGLVLGLARLVLGNWDRAALITSLLLLLFFTYGQVYAELKGVSLGGLLPFRHRTLGPLWIFVLGIGVYWLGWRVKAPQAATPWLNLLSLLMLIYPTFTITSTAIKNAMPVDSTVAAQASGASPGAGTVRPDIYYIILDGYGRKDVLAAEYGYDNSAFLDALRQRGFYIADCSQSNYAQTELSLSSSLNMNYLDGLGNGYYGLIVHSAVRKFLERNGYETVAFPTGFSWTELIDARYYIRPKYRSTKLTEFENLLLGTTMLRMYSDRAFSKSSNAERYRARTLSALAALKQLPAHKAPLFVFAHIVSPHYPYVLDAKGNPIDIEEDESSPVQRVKGYVGQVEFLNGQILQVVDAILANSETPPVIIIQGDHGPFQVTHDERMRNLNAYYLPEAKDKLYPEISPVNSFRLVLDTYFGQNLPLLKDKSYFSNYQKRTDYQVIPNSCPSTP